MRRATRPAAKPATGEANSGFPVPLTTPPMEAKSAAQLPEGRWQFEPKWDGFRCLAFKCGDLVELRAKSGKPLGRFFPEIVAMLQHLPDERFVVDGELVIELEGRLAFDALQMRLHPAESRIRRLSSETPARLMLFDMLADSDDAATMAQPLTARRAVLEAFIARNRMPKALEISPMTRNRAVAERWLREGADGDTDGVIAKALDGSYEAGARAMIKVKRRRTADCVVGGFRYESGSRMVGSLLLGLYNDEGKLDHVGFTATIADRDRPELTARLEAMREAPGFTGNAPGAPSRWSTERSTQWEPLRPDSVVEVSFDHVTGGRFRHGTKLLRWRSDKSPRQCTFEQMKPPLADPEPRAEPKPG